nr:MAG TPA: hypothetical protein [Caudoviricetes sp.]
MSTRIGLEFIFYIDLFNFSGYSQHSLPLVRRLSIPPGGGYAPGTAPTG